jgi:hypothetical protein
LSEQSVLSRSPAELTTIFYCLIWDSPNLEGQVPILISSRNRVAQLYPRTLISTELCFYPDQYVLVTRTQVKTLYKQQTSHTQNNTETNLDLRNATLRYGFYFQYRNSRTFPIEL